MLITEAERRDFSIDRKLAGSMAFIAGVVNAAGFSEFGLFGANMTGNVSAGSVRLAHGDLWGAALFAGIVGAFILGATGACLALEAGRRRGVRSAPALGILGEAVVLALIAGAVMGLARMDRAALLMPGISLLMGLQNAVTTRLSNGRVRSTHVSGMATDFGIEMGVLASAAIAGERIGAMDVCWARLRLHGQTIIAFGAGGVFGVWLYERIGLSLLLAASGALALLALWTLRGARRQNALTNSIASGDVSGD